MARARIAIRADRKKFVRFPDFHAALTAPEPSRGLDSRAANLFVARYAKQSANDVEQLSPGTGIVDLWVKESLAGQAW